MLGSYRHWTRNFHLYFGSSQERHISVKKEDQRGQELCTQCVTSRKLTQQAAASHNDTPTSTCLVSESISDLKHSAKSAKGWLTNSRHLFNLSFSFAFSSTRTFPTMVTALSGSTRSEGIWLRNEFERLMLAVEYVTSVRIKYQYLFGITPCGIFISFQG